jgi:hypothetical protein
MTPKLQRLHEALLGLSTKRKHRDQVGRWSSVIDAYNFEMTHCFSLDLLILLSDDQQNSLDLLIFKMAHSFYVLQVN